jgi:hypothetical protein
MIQQLLGRGDELRASAVPLSRIVAFGSSLELALLQLVGLVVLGVACANVAGLLIARQQAERHLIGMRAVLGARVRDLVALPLMDVAPLVMVGTALGLIFAVRTAPVAGAYLGTAMPGWAQPQVDSTVVIVTLVVAAIVSAAIALAPAREFFRADLRSWIQTGTLATAGSKQARTRQQILVGAQIGISTTLLVIAAVLVVNLAKLGADNERMQRQGMLRAPLSVPQGRDPNRLAEAVIERLRSEPGITGASTAKSATAGSRPRSVAIDDVPLAGATRIIGYQVGPRFSTVRQEGITAGRDLTDEEILGNADNVVVINEKMAQTLWRASTPLGRRVRFADDEPWRVVVGVRRNSAVTGSERVAGDAANAAPTYWIPGIASGARTFSLVVVTAPDADRFVPAVSKAIEKIAPNAVTMLLTDTRVMAARKEARVRTILLAVLASFALVMAVIGIGTLVAFSTSLRSREFGIRTAMGATAHMIAGEVVRDALRMSARGLLLAAVGTVGAYFAFIPMLYFNAKIFDWRIAAGAMGLMTLLIVVVSVVPAVRAARMNPANVLRGE